VTTHGPEDFKQWYHKVCSHSLIASARGDLPPVSLYRPIGVLLCKLFTLYTEASLPSSHMLAQVERTSFSHPLTKYQGSSDHVVLQSSACDQAEQIGDGALRRPIST
jgi:hypothetical protein